MTEIRAGVETLVLILGLGGRCDQCAADHSVRLQSPAALAQQSFDSRQNFVGKPLFLKQVAKAQDGALGGHTGAFSSSVNAR